MSDPDYEKIHNLIERAIDEYDAVHLDNPISIAIAKKMRTHKIQAGVKSARLPTQINLEDIPSENDGHDPGKRLLPIVIQLGGAGYRTDALELAQRAVHEFPYSPTAYICLAMASVVHGKDSDGLIALHTAAEILDTDEWALSHTEYQLEMRFEVAKYLRGLYDTAGAIRQFEKAIEIAEAANLPMWAARARKMLELV